MKKTNLLFIFFLTFLSNQLLNVLIPILPDLQVEFDISTVQITLPVFAVIFARIVISLPLGRYFRSKHLKQYLITAFSLVVISFFLLSRASAYLPFIIFVFIGALGSASIMILILLYVSKNSKKENRARRLGFYQAGLMIGAAFAPVFSGFINQYFGWRQAFLIMSIFYLFIMLNIFWLKLPGTGKEAVNDDKTTEEQIAEDQTSEDIVNRSNQEIASTSCGVNPLDKGKGRMRNLSSIIIINFVTFSLLFTMGGFAKAIIPLLGGNHYHLTSGQIGIGLLVVDLLRFLVLIGGSYISDKFSRRHVLVPGLLIGGLGMLLMSFGDELYFFYLGITLFGIGRIGNNFIVSLLCDLAPVDKIGMLTSVNRFVADTGLLTGPIILGLVMSHFGVNILGILAALIIWTASLMLFLFIQEKQKETPGQ